MVTLCAASGYAVHFFPTGQGNVIGNPILPVIKICANPRTVRLMSEHIDVDTSGLLQREINLDQAGDKLLEMHAAHRQRPADRGRGARPSRVRADAAVRERLSPDGADRHQRVHGCRRRGTAVGPARRAATTRSSSTIRPGCWPRPAGADVLIVRNRTQVRGELLAALTRCKVVGRLGVGLDNIDVEACAARGIEVIPATGANARSVAEYVIACGAAAAARGLPVERRRGGRSLAAHAR